ncbi:hypothetical protein LINPERPRIM_LOCUS28071 [Linum perenne]
MSRSSQRARFQRSLVFLVPRRVRS